MDWFEEHSSDFKVMSWPPNSPDLNPIEHVWSYLENKFRAATLPPRNVRELQDQLMFRETQWTWSTDVKKRSNSKNHPFRKYAKFVFKQSLITGFPNIALSKSWKRKFWKISVFLVCLVGFLYQTSVFLQYYWTYPTTTYVEESSPYEIVQPALTLCSKNRIRRHIYCERNDSLCNFHYDNELFCEEYPKFCINNTSTYTGIPSIVDTLHGMFSINWEEAEELSPTSDIITDCWKRANVIISNCTFRSFPIVSKGSNPTFCYTLDSQLNEPDAEDDIYPNTFIHFKSFRDIEKYAKSKINIKGQNFGAYIFRVRNPNSSKKGAFIQRKFNTKTRYASENRGSMFNGETRYASENRCSRFNGETRDASENQCARFNGETR
ncbi:uncharacterized protein [Parasteatoda tepidariorum]|uniref:uncharacterized protein n=1 Tax=Parasteatoda tepidariorum TaxID=114398 RepID=UPI0039BD3B91